MIAEGEYGYPTVNVRDEQKDPGSLLRWFQNALPALRECPEFGIGNARCSTPGTSGARACATTARAGSVLAVLNLSTEQVYGDAGPAPACHRRFPVDVLSYWAYPDARHRTKVHSTVRLPWLGSPLRSARSDREA